MYAKCEKDCIRNQVCERYNSKHQSIVNYDCGEHNNFEWFIGKWIEKEVVEDISDNLENSENNC